MTPLGEVLDAPDEFQQALASLRAASVRPEVVLEESPAPSRLAPYAVALSADVVHNANALATGRLVLLYDPSGQDGWEGCFRFVSYLNADLEPEIATDPLLAKVGWSWLTEALAAHNAAYTAAGGTVTRSASESFGAIGFRPEATEVEVRASWTPTGADLAPHLLAWCDALCAAAGLPPVPSGVIPLRQGPAW